MKIKHGLSKSRFYVIFHCMSSRCNNPKNSSFRNYGKRGIKITWKSFEDFKKDMYISYKVHIKNFGEMNTTIDRIDNSKNYSKENCRWATRKEQANNTRSNVFYEFKGKKDTLPNWARKVNINKSVLESRILDSNWSVERALTTPVNKHNLTFMYEFNGECNSIIEWSKKIGISRDLIRRRIKKGWSLNKIFTTQKMKNQFG